MARRRRSGGALVALLLAAACAAVAGLATQPVRAPSQRLVRARTALRHRGPPQGGASVAQPARGADARQLQEPVAQFDAQAVRWPASLLAGRGLTRNTL